MKILLSLYLIFSAVSLSAQYVDKTVMANAGNSLVGSEVSMDFTIGEPIVGLVHNELSIDQGFWAGSLRVEPLQPEKELGGIVVYPNPVGDELNIFTNSNRLVGITLFSVNGQRVLKEKVEASQLEHHINVNHLSKGTYVLSLFLEESTEEKMFKIIKK